MNIKEAKDEIKNTLTVYFTKNEFGNYVIPIEKQRPVFLMGPPGIGKTAIMAQIASEMGVGLLSYSMTHHTRQSAIGLPFIEKKTYGGQEYTVSEYTLSEIIASIYELMENTGLKEGILFLDEINCVSETLAPVMLQLLQYKVFGKHKIPTGWVIVTAGNPPEYNNAVREYDIATWDRLKRIDITPDFEIWKDYAYKANVHMSIISYLESKTADFYTIESTVDSKAFATARGWEDLSQMIDLYEKHGIPVKETLVSQYLQNRKVAKSFSAYYDLYVKYRGDYQIDKIMDGEYGMTVKQKAVSAKFDERVMLISLLLDAINEDTLAVVEKISMIADARKLVRKYTKKVEVGDKKPIDVLNDLIAEQKKDLDKRVTAGNLTDQERRNVNAVIEFLEKQMTGVMNVDAETAVAHIKSSYNALTRAHKKEAKLTSARMDNAFRFVDDVFGDGQEMLILVTELTQNYYGSKFISNFGCDEYFKHNKSLLFYERDKEIMDEIAELDLDF
ncbi:MAG: AAA family ATPase [Oscillospiraceae bacterium]|nr:AAA family ATPase [Oscillospiraceae bacterium]